MFRLTEGGAADATRERLVVVGNGMVSLRFLEELTARAPQRYAVTVIGREPEPAYNRVLLSSLLAGDVTLAESLMRDRDWYAARGIRLLTGTPVTAIDRAARTVTCAGGETLGYDRLVLATGSDPIRLPTPGMNLAGVHTFRDLADVSVLEALPAGASAAVIGGGLLGIEAAVGLAGRGVRVTLVHLMDRLMERQIDGPAATLVRKALEARGITVLTGADTRCVTGTDRATGLELTDGRHIPADLVVVAVGVRPCADLARAAGLEVGRGIRVDDRLATSDPAIHAVGECLEHRGQVYGLVEPGYRQAAVLAGVLAGETATYGGSVLSTNLKVSGLPVFSAGAIDGTDTVTLSDPAHGGYRKLVFGSDAEGRLLLTGVVLVGDTADGLWYLDLLRRAVPVCASRSDLVFGKALCGDLVSTAPAAPALAEAA
jgi:nitrite reductase (NADH) large subunit